MAECRRYKVITIDVLECGEMCCEYCTKNKCIYMEGGALDEAKSGDRE